MFNGQILKGTLSNLVGIALGILSNIWLFPLVFSLEELGIYRWVERMSSLITVIVLFGIHRTYVRYQSQFSKHDARLFLSNILVLILFIAVLSGIIFYKYINYFSLFFKMKYFEEMSVLGVVITGSVFYTFGLSVSATKNKISIPFFIKNVFVRISLIIAAFLLFYNKILFSEWMWIFAYTHLAIGLMVLIYGLYQKKLSLVRPRLKPLLGRKEFLLFSGSGVVIGILSMSVTTLDSQIIVSTIGFEALGIYSMAYFIGNIVESARRPMSVSLTPAIADYWNKEDYDSLKRIYKNSSKILTSTVVVAAILIIPNLDFLVSIIPDPERFEGLKTLVILVLFSRLIDYLFGANSEILSNGPYYIFNVWATCAFILVMLVLNLLLIPTLGLNGVALTTVISYLVYNLLKAIYLFKKLHINPFTRTHFKILGIGCILLLLPMNISNISLIGLCLINLMNIFVIIYVYIKLKDELNLI